MKRFPWQAVWLMLPLVLCVLITTTASARSTVSYSIPSGQLMPYLHRIDIPSRVRIKYARQPWHVAATRDELATCSIAPDGVLTARRTVANRQAVACEWSLFLPHTRLVPGWLVQRAHWHGDVREARFISNPTFTDNPYVSIQLSVPTTEADDRKNDRSNTTHKLGLRLLTLRGPEGFHWRDAFQW